MNTRRAHQTSAGALLGLLASAALHAPALAAFTGLIAQDVSKVVGTPPGLKTIQLVATFNDPTDRVFGVAGERLLGPLQFSTDDPEGLRNDGGSFNGQAQEDFPTPVGALWDSWVAIGNTSSHLNLHTSPGFLGGGGGNKIEGSAFMEGNGGWYIDFDDAVAGGLVLIAQFTIGADYQFELRGLVSWIDENHPAYASSAFHVTSEGADAAGACCLTPTLCLGTTEQPCLTLGGVFLGTGTECVTQVVNVPCHPGDVAQHCVGTIATCPEEGPLAGGPDCTAGPLLDPWQSRVGIEPEDPNSFHDFGAPGQTIPAGFFGPGSDPLSSTVPLRSVPLGPVDLSAYGGGVVAFGDADTLVLRVDDPFPRCAEPSPDEAAVSVRVIALLMQSLDPVVVSYNGGSILELWTMEVSLSALEPPDGVLHAVKTHCNGGTYSVASLPVQPRFTFRNVDDPQRVVTLDTGREGLDPIQLTLEQGEWVHVVAPWLSVDNPYCTDFHAGFQEEFPIVECDCFFADVSGDGTVSVTDLTDVILGWGACGAGPCAMDTNCDGDVDVQDLVNVILRWGRCG